MERMLGAELTEHLGYEPNGEPAEQQANRRNDTTRKVLKGNDGAVPIDIPRDRNGSFEPELIQKGQTRIDGMDDKIIGLYAAGLWIANNEGAKFWLSIMNNLKNRGLEDILIAVVDGLKGFPEAIARPSLTPRFRPASCTWCAIP